MAVIQIKKRSSGRGGKYTSATLTVPVEIADLIEEEQGFQVELTEEGLLYRPITKAEAAKLPAWLQNGQQ